jgi:chemotaxis methyl-accepting protein methylase
MTGDAAVEAVVDEVGELLDARIGLRPQSTLRGRLRRCIRDEASAHGDDLESYLGRLPLSGELMQSLVNRVTVQESGFFRHPDHFEVLVNDVFPTLPSPVTIWSAGCANGQEAYSLAMLLEEKALEGSVLATDLSTSALARTAAGQYKTREIGGVSPLRRARHLTRDGDNWSVRASLRARVVTLQHNLLEHPPAAVATCQVVFCRNVLIYFSPEHTQAFLDKLAAILAPGAYLFLGSAESLWQVTEQFEAVRLGDSFVYRRRGAPVRRPATREVQTTALVRAKAPQGTARVRTVARAAVTTPAAAVAPAEIVHTSDTEVLAATGRRCLEAGDVAAAVVAFRKWAYLTPEDPFAALHLALALEAGGHHDSARRAYDVARAAVARSEGAIEATDLGGYAPDELVRLLDSKQVRHS